MTGVPIVAVHPPSGMRARARMRDRDWLPAGAPALQSSQLAPAPRPWITLSRAECLLPALALQRSARGDSGCAEVEVG